MPEPEGTIEVRQRDSIGFGPVVKAVFGEYKRRSLLGFMLMVAQAFLYNAIFFTYALVLANFYGVSPILGRLLHPARSRPETSSARCCWAGYSTWSGARS